VENPLATNEIWAHMGMFAATSNDGYHELELDVAKINAVRTIFFNIIYHASICVAISNDARWHLQKRFKKKICP
jgi:hypothetical protein